METLNPRAGFLCNHEVLSILRSHRDQRASQLSKIHQRRGPARDEEEERIQPQDLHTVTFEAIKYLEEPVHPLRRQTTESISALLDELDKLDLTRAERLQIVNLAPTTLVALVVCVDDFEDRFPSEEQQTHILDLISNHLSTHIQAASLDHTASRHTNGRQRNGVGAYDQDDATYAEMEDEDGDLVQEGLEGGAEEEARDIDEVNE